MYAVVIDEGQLHWQQRPDPVPGDHEVVVAVRAAGVNGADISQRAGNYPAPPGWPQDVPGLEMAGEVAAVGARVTRFAVGDRVMALVGGGAQAELAVVDEAHALPVPAGLSWPEAGGFMEAFATAYDALFGQAGLTLGDRVLVTGAAGGVGTAAVQLAATAGARVVASVRDTAQHEAVAALGATEVVEPGAVVDHGPVRRRPRARRRRESAFGARGARRPRACRGHRRRQRRDGRGRPHGADADPRPPRRVEPAVRAPAARRPSSSRRSGSLVVPALAGGRLRVPVAATFPLADATAGLRALRRRGQGGQDRPDRLSRGRPPGAGGPADGPAPAARLPSGSPWPDRRPIAPSLASASTAHTHGCRPVSTAAGPRLIASPLSPGGESRSRVSVAPRAGRP